MIRGHPAMYLIVRRPFVWLFSFLLQVFAVLLVEMMQDGAVDPARLAGLSAPGGAPGDWTALWRLCIAIPFAGAILPMAMATDALGSRHTWSLPDFRRRLLPGFATAALLPCCYIPVLIATSGAWRIAMVSFVVGVATVAYLLVIITSEHRTVRWAVTLPMALLFLDGARYGTWLIDLSLAWIPVAMAGVALLVSRTSTTAMRGYVEALKGMTLFDVRAGLLGAPAWRTKLVATGTLAWVRAAHFEEFGSKRFGLLRDSGYMIAAFVLLHSVIGDARTSTVVPVFMGAMIGFNRAPVLRFGATYPLSRRRRATVAYLGIVSAILAGLMLAVAIVATLSIVTERFQPDWPRLGRSIFLILPFVPLMIVPRLRANIRTSGRDTVLAIAIGLASLLVLSVLTKRILDQLEDPVAIAAFVVTVIAAPQVYLWFRLRRFYTTGDLV